MYHLLWDLAMHNNAIPDAASLAVTAARAGVAPDQRAAVSSSAAGKHCVPCQC